MKHKSQFRRVNPAISFETEAEQSAAKRFNPARVATFKRKRCTLSAGTSDTVVCWVKGNSLYALSLNSRLGYVGLQVFDLSTDGKTADETGNYFAQNAFEQLPRDDMNADPFDMREIDLLHTCREYADA